MGIPQDTLVWGSWTWCTSPRRLSTWEIGLGILGTLLSEIWIWYTISPLIMWGDAWFQLDTGIIGCLGSVWIHVHLMLPYWWGSVHLDPGVQPSNRYYSLDAICIHQSQSREQCLSLRKPLSSGIQRYDVWRYSSWSLWLLTSWVQALWLSSFWFLFILSQILLIWRIQSRHVIGPKGCPEHYSPDLFAYYYEMTLTYLCFCATRA